MLSFPNDVNQTDWDSSNLSMWQKEEIAKLSDGRDVILTPIEAKALHVIGLLVRIMDAAGHLLYFTKDGEVCGPCADYYLHAYLIACSAIELFSRCRQGEPDFNSRKFPPNVALKEGFKLVKLVPESANSQDEILSTNEEIYNLDKLVALRNLAAHGIGVASAHKKVIKNVFLHIELLDNFPDHLGQAIDQYYADLFDPSKYEVRKNLAKAGLHPVLYYPGRSGQAFISPIKYAYYNIIIPEKKPSEILKYKDWQVYKGG